jgi:hypothetical protein
MNPEQIIPSTPNPSPLFAPAQRPKGGGQFMIIITVFGLER